MKRSIFLVIAAGLFVPFLSGCFSLTSFVWSGAKYLNKTDSFDQVLEHDREFVVKYTYSRARRFPWDKRHVTGYCRVAPGARTCEQLPEPPPWFVNREGREVAIQEIERLSWPIPRLPEKVPYVVYLEKTTNRLVIVLNNPGDAPDTILGCGGAPEWWHREWWSYPLLLTLPVAVALDIVTGPIVITVVMIELAPLANP